jgi:two-component system cell cycle sensor histidine kinase/response regulator CckA
MKDGLIRILLVEDNLGDARLVKEALAEIRTTPHEFVHVVRLSEGLKKLEEADTDVVLLDLSLPDGSGLETVRQTQLKAPTVPIVVLTGFDDEAFALKAVREGAQDYLIKGHLDGNLLLRAMRYAIERHQLLAERKQAEDALRASQEYAFNLIESSLDMIIATDENGFITEFNKAAQRTFGYEPLEILGKHLRLLYAEPEESLKVHAAILRNGTCVGEGRQVRKNGQVFPCFLSASIIRDTQDKLVGVVSISRDITEQTNLEEQLRQSKKMESIGQLAGGIAHDFNNLLTVIHGHASLLLSAGQLGEEVADSVMQISLAAERAANLTRQLLAFSRRQVIQATYLDINDLIDNLGKMLRRILGEDIALQVNHAPHVPLVLADKGMIEQVVMNLVVNARDAMPAGGQLVIDTSVRTIGEAGVESEPEAIAGEFVCLSVKDSGCGIAPEHLPHIFEPFFTTKEVGKGTGLGLATVYGIAKQHQGWINVESEAGKGSVFRLFLPSRPEAIAIAEDQQREQTRGGTEAVLVVEDELAVRALVRTVLESYGYRVFEASSGSMALEVWRKHMVEIDLLFTDMVMPGGMTGRDLAGILKSDKPGLKVVFTSGYSEEIVGKSCALEEGMNFLQKPYNPGQIAQAVRMCLDNP